ncbi:MAG: Zn-dependent exopeptidase M28, partial [Clostridiales bacterium]|nr:Zn-dependent exopeptidase M28 [Clostridiales bacterium]
EQGLLGSKAYIEQHEELVKSEIKFCFNFDMCGTVLGPNNICITGGKELEDFVELFCREVGYSARTRVGVHSSDSAPFADLGIPGLGLSRGTSTSEIHTCRDTMFPLGEKALKENIAFAAAIMERVVNAVLLPVDTGMPDNIKKELDKYFQRTDK